MFLNMRFSHVGVFVYLFVRPTKIIPLMHNAGIKWMGMILCTCPNDYVLVSFVTKVS